MVDLKSRLEKVIKDSDERSRYSAPGRSEVSLLNAGSLSSRYDFNAFLKDHAWNLHPVASSAPSGKHASPRVGRRTQVQITSVHSTQHGIASYHEEATLSLQRLLAKWMMDVILPPPCFECDPEDLLFAPPPCGKSGRNHTRGYFDLAMTDGLTDTSGSPTRVKTAPAPAPAPASVPSTHKRAFPTITLSSSQRHGESFAFLFARDGKSR
jgi:hypothetical protein